MCCDSQEWWMESELGSRSGPCRMVIMCVQLDLRICARSPVILFGPVEVNSQRSVHLQCTYPLACWLCSKPIVLTRLLTSRLQRDIDDKNKYNSRAHVCVIHAVPTLFCRNMLCFYLYWLISKSAAANPTATPTGAVRASCLRLYTQQTYRHRIVKEFFVGLGFMLQGLGFMV